VVARASNNSAVSQIVSDRCNQPRVRGVSSTSQDLKWMPRFLTRTGLGEKNIGLDTDGTRNQELLCWRDPAAI
jgi:hypothetical protein